MNSSWILAAVVVVFGIALILVLRAPIARFRREREMRRVRQEVADRGLEAVLEEIEERRLALDEEERGLQANAAHCAAGYVGRFQTRLHREMRALDRYRELVLQAGTGDDDPE